jgi:microcystin degradation protein MlrC
MHAHITSAMIENCDALIGYQHYPHDDTFQTGERGLALLADIVDGRIAPHVRACRIPLLAPAQHQRTRGDGPMTRIFQLARSRESARVPAVSYFCVQPWLDFPRLGFTSVVVAEDAGEADVIAREIAAAMWDLRRDFLVETHDPATAIRQGLRSEGYVVLADAADCVGGGASGDSAAALAALLSAAPDFSAAIHIVDAEVAREAATRRIGERFAVGLGNKLDPSYGRPLDLDVELVSRCDGRFVYSGGLMQGVEARMGETAVLRAGAISILVSSLSAYEYGDEAFAANGIDVRGKKFVVVKNPMNYQKAYSDAAAQYILDTPGPTTPNLASLPWSRLDRPTFPIDEDCEPGFAMLEEEEAARRRVRGLS